MIEYLESADNRFVESIHSPRSHKRFIMFDVLGRNRKTVKETKPISFDKILLRMYIEQNTRVLMDVKAK